jgi:hypothetical protein
LNAGDNKKLQLWYGAAKSNIEKTLDRCITVTPPLHRFYRNIGCVDCYSNGIGRLAPKVIFLGKSQVKSTKSQVMTLTFLKKTKKSES